MPERLRFIVDLNHESSIDFASVAKSPSCARGDDCTSARANSIKALVRTEASTEAFDSGDASNPARFRKTTSVEIVEKHHEHTKTELDE